MESDRFAAVLGPFWSNSGTKTWSLLFGADTIVAVPYTFFESFQFGLRVNLGFWPRDPGAAFRAAVLNGAAGGSLPPGPALRRYHAHLLRAIVIRSNATANTLTFEKLSGESDEYAIALRDETDRYRAVLGGLYPGKYQEKDFPAGAIGRLLRK